MYFLLSGEGPTDIGLCTDGAPTCEGGDHDEGPMAIFVDQLVEQRSGHSFINTSYYGFVSKTTLVEKAKPLKLAKKSPRLPGKKKDKETSYFYLNARALALYAKEKERELDEEVVAILFRDSDGTASAGRGLWRDKFNSMVRGFDEEGFRRGVPMVPKPKSEAWLICAVKENPYEGCTALEDRSGNDNAPWPLKDQLADLLDGATSRAEICDMMRDGTIDVSRIDMPSMTAFKDALQAALQS